MAKCPKCGKKLTFFNVSQFCPECGVNMRFYNFEETFTKEAKYAELSNAVIHVKIRRLKASLIGSKLTIARLIVALLPVLSLLVPAGNVDISLPFKERSIAIGGLGIYDMFTAGDLDFILAMRNSEIAGAGFNAFFIALIGYVAVALFVVLTLLMTVLCFCSYKKMQKVICTFASLGIVAAIADFILVLRMVSACKNCPVISASEGFGLIVAIVMFAVVFVINAIINKKGIDVEYDEGMLERSEIYYKVKKHEISLDDLPQPVIETAETRKIDEEIAKEQAALLKKENEKKEESADA